MVQSVARLELTVMVVAAVGFTVTVFEDVAVPFEPVQVRVKAVVCDGVTFSPVAFEVPLVVLVQFV